MRIVVQRVSRARVSPGGAIGPRALRAAWRRAADGEDDAARLAGKSRGSVSSPTPRAGSTARFSTSAARSLVVSQFTLIADTAKGNRPSFTEAAPPEVAEPVYERFCAELRALGVTVETGVFGAKMELELVNDGPVTLVLDV